MEKKEKYVLLQWRDSLKSTQTQLNDLQEKAWNITEGSGKAHLLTLPWKGSVPKYRMLFKKVKDKIAGSGVQEEE